MFQSKNRPIVISQYEHGRLAGTLAWWWGNDKFARPAVDFAAFVQGVTLHDWGYGLLDNQPILGLDEATWLAIIERGAANYFADPTTDIVVKLHLRRLLAGHSEPAARELMVAIDDRVKKRLPETGRTMEQFVWADTVTALCDRLAFYFCFEDPGTGTGQVCHRLVTGEKKAVNYELLPGGVLVVDPWPFATPMLGGTLIGFQRDGYPDRLEPLAVPFFVHGR